MLRLCVNLWKKQEPLKNYYQHIFRIVYSFCEAVVLVDQEITELIAKSHDE